MVYAILARGLLNASEHLRAKCLDLYAKILKSGRADPQLVERLDGYLDELYSGWAAWKLVLLIVCAVFVALPARKLRTVFVGPSEPTYLEDIPEAVRKDFDRFTSYWILSVVANSPAAALIFWFHCIDWLGLPRADENDC
jgi:hypothetical protein